jgi:hypothetical protein
MISLMILMACRRAASSRHALGILCWRHITHTAHPRMFPIPSRSCAVQALRPSIVTCTCCCCHVCSHALSAAASPAARRRSCGLHVLWFHRLNVRVVAERGFARVVEHLADALSRVDRPQVGVLSRVGVRFIRHTRASSRLSSVGHLSQSSVGYLSVIQSSHSVLSCLMPSRLSRVISR